MFTVVTVVTSVLFYEREDVDSRRIIRYGVIGGVAENIDRHTMAALDSQYIKTEA